MTSIRPTVSFSIPIVLRILMVISAVFLSVFPLGACGDDSGAGAGDAGTGSDALADAQTGSDGSAGQDGSTQADSALPSDGGADSGAPPSGWLRTEGNRILREDDSAFRGRGANLHDTRSCWACAWYQPDVEEVKRRADELVDVWGANFVRLLLESYPDDQGGAVQWQPVLDDPAYLADVIEIVDHLGTKPGVYVLLSHWVDPSFTAEGWPSAGTIDSWELLADVFRDYSYVLYGLVNEPEANYDGSQDAACWTAMNDTVAAIRAVEDQQASPHHVIAVQGTRAWARVLDYYITHPITAGGGVNIAYETHVYDSESEFDDRFVTPSQTLPVIIGEFGPADGYMTLADSQTLMDEAENLEIPYLAWTFHPRCPPNLLVDNSGGGCGVNMSLVPTAWGQLLMDRLAAPY